MKIKIGQKKFELRAVILIAIMVVLIGFILGNLFLVVDYDSTPTFVQKIVISETDFANRVVNNLYYEGEVSPRSGSSCQG